MGALWSVHDGKKTDHSGYICTRRGGEGLHRGVGMHKPVQVGWDLGVLRVSESEGRQSIVAQISVWHHCLAQNYLTFQPLSVLCHKLSFCAGTKKTQIPPFIFSNSLLIFRASPCCAKCSLKYANLSRIFCPSAQERNKQEVEKRILHVSIRAQCSS